MKEVSDSIYEIVKDLKGIEQNQALALVLKKIQGDRIERHAKLLEELQAVKVAMEDLDKMAREAVKF